MKKVSFFLIVLLIVSCSRTDEAKMPVEEAVSFYGLKEGNSWVYKSFRRNRETDSYEDINVVDSVSVLSREIIDGETFFKVRTKTTGNEKGIAFCNPNGTKYEFLRDSLGSLINDKGEILFVNNTNDKFFRSERVEFEVFTELKEETRDITTEAGEFKTLDMETYAIDLKDSKRLPGKDNDYYSPGIGLILKKYSTVSDSKHLIERRLQSYTIK